jgi:hypothetical protein
MSTGVRDRFANAVLGAFDPPKTADRADLDLHREYMQRGTESMGRVLDPRVAQALMDAAGYANEAASGGLQALRGRPFFSESGFDWQDMLANRQGQEAGVAALQERYPESARSLLGILLGAAYRDPEGRWANVIGAEETPTNAEAQDAFRTLNRLVDQWAAERLKIPFVTSTTFTLSASTASFTVGSSGNVNITRPAHIDRVQYRDSNGDDTDLTKLTQQAWMSISDKDLEATRPAYWYYEPTYASSQGTLYLWPVADTAATGIVWHPTAISEFSATTDTLTVPLGYENFMVTQLAKKLSAGYGRQPSPLLMEDAMEAERAIKRLNARVEDLHIDAGALVGRGGGRYSIYTDT